MPFKVIHVDQYFMVVNKNAGLPTSPTIDPKRMTLFSLCARLSSTNSNEIRVSSQHALS